MTTHITRTLAGLISVWVAFNISGCVDIFSGRMPTGGLSMADAYAHAISGTAGHDAGTPNQLRARVKPLRSRSRCLRVNANNRNHIKAPHFARLSNPDVRMYVYPHNAGIGRTQVPIPGYTTVFALYSAVHYAMPGERVAKWGAED